MSDRDPAPVGAGAARDYLAQKIADGIRRLQGQRDRAREVAVLLEQQVAAVAALHARVHLGEMVFCCICSEHWPCRTAAAVGAEP